MVDIFGVLRQFRFIICWSKFYTFSKLLLVALPLKISATRLCTQTPANIQNFRLFDSSGTLIDSTYIKKHWMHPKLIRTELEEDFCATLFKPPGDGPFPVVLDISGTGGGIHEHKGAMLASEGFVVLCLAFFQFKYLPQKMEDVDMEYFAVSCKI